MCTILCVIFFFLVGCAPDFDTNNTDFDFEVDSVGTTLNGGTSTTPPDKIGEVIENDNVEVTLSVYFDSTSFPHALVTCDGNTNAATFDEEGWAYFTQDFQCDWKYLNVGSAAGGPNTFAGNLAEIIIDEASDTAEGEDQPDLAPLLHLWVFEGEYEAEAPMLEPQTENAIMGGFFWGCDEPRWDPAYGMPYARAGTEGVDLCETTPPE